MRLVIDTNVVVSAQVWGGAPRRLLELAADGVLSLFTSAPLLDELTRVLAYPKVLATLQARGFSLDDLVLGYAELANVVAPAAIEATIVADPTDDDVLAAAVAAQADPIVSGDKRHLLALGSFRGIPTGSVADALRRIGA
ncbi:MAG: putative toxin-antitoxin system toxin component, PIN family [Betaproteobacteria bacterium]